MHKKHILLDVITIILLKLGIGQDEPIKRMEGETVAIDGGVEFCSWKDL